MIGRYPLITLMVFLSFFPLSLLAQDDDKGLVRGFVYERETGQEIPFANVFVRDISKGTETNTEGFYNLELAPGEYTIESSLMGYEEVTHEINVEAGETVTQNFYLLEKGIDLDDVEIRDERIRQEEIRVGEIDIEPGEIERMPAVGGSPDLAQYLQVLPGVTFSGDQGGQLFIKGGSPVQNKVLMDGLTVHNPFHSIGLFSVFDVDAVENIDVMTGGFGAEYGGRTSSVIDISMREGNRLDHKGTFSLTPFIGEALLEGPIIPYDQGEGYSLTYLFSARGSYLEETSPILYPHAGDGDNGLPYNFLDFYGKVSFHSDAGNEGGLYGFRLADRVNFEETKFQWDSYGIGTDFQFVPSGGTTVIDGSLGYSQYEVQQQERDERPRYSTIDGMEANFNVTYFLDNDHIEYGFDIKGNSTDFEFFNQANRRISEESFSSEIGGYVHYHTLLDNWVLDPGIRLHYYSSLSEMQFEPRMAAQYNFTNYLRANISGGWYSQNLVSTTSDRDVVNLFEGFLSSPDRLADDFRGNRITSNLQKSRHLMGGIEFDFLAHSSVTLEGYVKDFTQLINLNRNKIFDFREFPEQPSHLRMDFIREEGIAYGSDLKLLYDRNPLFLWGVYSLAFVERTDELQTYNPHWDRRHNIDIMAGYRFGEDDSWEVNVRWNFGTGFPFTKTQGFYENLTFDDGAATDFATENGELGIIYSDLNTGQLPNYHRLDMNIEKTFFFEEDRELEINAGLTNAYNRNNVFFFDRVSHERVDQLPILPSLGLTYSY